MARKLAEQNGRTVRIVGIDISNKMLEVARQRAPGIEWLYGDMRMPQVGGTFDIAICCFNGLQLLLKDDDLLRCFRSVREHLVPGGIFAFGIYQPSLQFLNAPHPHRLVRSFTDGQGRRLEVHESGEYDPSARVLISDWQLMEQGGVDGASLANMRALMRQYFPEEIERLLAAADLTMTERYGDYDRSPFTATSKRQVVICCQS
jgi:SAM-dependent methyltransferase